KNDTKKCSLKNKQPIDFIEINNNEVILIQHKRLSHLGILMDMKALNFLCTYIYRIWFKKLLQ
ncbi:TPA: hypothetical protein ACNOIR_005996, partial [Klebsiella variicola]